MMRATRQPDWPNLNESQALACARAQLDQADAAEQETMAAVRYWNEHVRKPGEQPIALADLKGST